MKTSFERIFGDNPIRKIKIFFSLIIFFGALLLVFWPFFEPEKNKDNFRQIEMAEVYFVGKKDAVFQVELARTPAQQAEGLMRRDSLPPNSGMLFVFSNEDTRSFWMKNTKIPLDLIYISADNKVVDIKNNFLPCYEDPCQVFSSPAPAKYVLEINSGLAAKNKIAAGDEILIKE